MKCKSAFKAFTDPIWKENQILVAILGICSALAVTIQVEPALIMGISVIFVTAFSSLFVSLLRNYTPDSVRMITELAIVSTFVIIVDQVLKAYFFELSKVLSVFVSLIITNCLVMGRAEAMAKNNSPGLAFLDGAGAALGYAIVILLVGCIREFFGFGTLLGVQIIPISWYATPSHLSRYVNANFMALAPSAFFIIGFFIWIYNLISRRFDHVDG